MENKLHHFQFHFLSFLLFTIPSCMAQEAITSTDPSYYYNLCSTSKCNTTPLAYPFGLPRFCHHPSLTPACTADGRYLLSTQKRTRTHRVLSGLAVDAYGATPLVAADSLFGCGQVSMSSLDYTYDSSTIFSLPNNYTFGTHLNCTRRPSSAGAGGLQPAACLACRDEGNVCFYSPGFVSFPECEVFHVISPQGFNVTAKKDLRRYLRKGFLIRPTLGRRAVLPALLSTLRAVADRELATTPRPSIPRAGHPAWPRRRQLPPSLQLEDSMNP